MREEGGLSGREEGDPVREERGLSGREEGIR